MPAVSLGVRKTDIPYFGAWLGHWSIESRYAEGLRAELTSLNVRAHLATLNHAEDDDKRPRGVVSMSRDDLATATELDEFAYALIDGVAIINVRGPMTKHRSSWGGTCSTLELRRQIRHANANQDVLGIIYFLETPGGTVSGMHELANDAASVQKPSLAYCNDLTASAGYWFASQCDEISANAPALVGSIGTYCVVADASKMYADAGVAIHVVKAGAHKGDFTLGTEVTPEQLTLLQADIEAVNQFFLDAVAAGREMSPEQVASIADGRAHLAAKALELGLIDAVEPWDACFERFAARVNGNGIDEDEESDTESSTASHTEPNDMAESKHTPATLAELETAIPKASAKFRARCIENQLTLEESRAHYIELLEARTAELAAEAKGTGGVKANGTHINGKSKSKKARAEDEKEDDEETSAEDDMEDEESAEEDSEETEEDEVVSRWNSAMARELKSTGGDRRKAFRNCCAKNPGLRAAYTAATNAQSMRARRQVAAVQAAAARSRAVVRSRQR